VAWYIETSAFLKLVVAEQRSSSMRRWFGEHNPCWSSELLRTEALRAASRLRVDPADVEDILENVSLILPAVSTFRAAALVRPIAVRSLDALHIATALEIGLDLEGLVTYDERVIQGAREASLRVVSP